MCLRCNKLYAYILVIFSGAGCLISAQDIQEYKYNHGLHELNLLVGLGFHSERDQMMTPMKYSGTLIPLRLAYEYLGTQNRFGIVFNFSSGNMESAISNVLPGAHEANNFNMDASFSWAVHITDIEKYNSALFGGARLASMLNFRNYRLLIDKKQTSAELMTGIGLYFRSETFLTHDCTHNLIAEISLPLINYAVLTRRFNANVSEKFDNLDYKENMLMQLFANGDIVLPDKLFLIKAELTYFFRLSQFFRINVVYGFQYYYFNQYKSLYRAKDINQQILWGIVVDL
ncbi:MAG: hypothetical protein LWX56_04085 [Ignavibacteria bacterium]|nr:hypothetical protein [Ignavibacteria bacterium]